MMKKSIASFLLFLLAFFQFSFICYADDKEQEILHWQELQDVLQTSSEANQEPSLNSKAAVIYDRDSKQVLLGKQENTRRPMASTTKIMTAIVVLEKANLTDIVEVSKKAAGVGGSRLGLKAKDKVSVLDLLYGLLLVSGNDAAVALAETVGGNVEGFANLMNQKAQELNLKDSHFVTPHGLDQPEHYTTAYELAKMADYALAIPKFAQIVNTKNYTVTINGYPKNLSNTNELLGNLEGVNGVKTGFTNGANRCLVTSVKRGDMNIITVVLGADTKKFRTSDSIKLIQYAYNQYEIVHLKEMVELKWEQWKKEKEHTISIEKGKQSIPVLALEENINWFLPIQKGEKEKITVQIQSIQNLKSPVEKGEKIGEIVILVGGKVEKRISILIAKEIPSKGIIDYMKEFLTKYCYYLEQNYRLAK